MRKISDDFFYGQLPSGLRVVALQRPGAAVEHIGVAVNVGSRDEAPDQFGLAHFVEHTIFKGTDRRRAWHILNRMERVGGELNAYTTKEETVIYSTFPRGNALRAMDLVADLVCNSRFPAAELDRERSVVADEIDTYMDIPSEGVFDDFDELIFAGSELEHSILGSKQSVEQFDSATCLDYLNRFYTPSRMVVFYSGASGPDAVMRMAERCFGALSRPDVAVSRVAPRPVETFAVERDAGVHQAHTVLGARVENLTDHESRFAMRLLTNILGGPGMNSLLNVALRERRGLVYGVDASWGKLTDTGLFSVYFGCDAEDVDQCVRLTSEVIDSVASGAITDRRLAEAKRQYLGQLTVGSTNTEQGALSMARSLLRRGTAVSRAEVEAGIAAVTSAQIRESAARLTSLSRLTLK